MTLLEFIKSQVSNDTPLGTLSMDILGDKDFPADQSEARILSYLEYNLGKHSNIDMFNKLKKAYNKKKDELVEPTNLDAKFTILRSEQWRFYKENFRIDHVYMVGAPNEIYRIFTVDASSGTALRFDLQTTRNLDDLSIISENEINKGELTKLVTIDEAILALEINNKNEPFKPTEPNFKELIEFLKKNTRKHFNS